MKKIVSLTMLFIVAVLFSCQDKINVDGIIGTYAPTILSYYPQVSVKQGDFPLKATFVSGSPLKSGTLTLKDGSGATLYTTGAQNLSGIKDSVVVQGSTFSSSNLALGTYTLEASATAENGKITTNSYSFDVSLTLYPATNTEMYISGAFDGWVSSQAMTLVAPFTWQITTLDVKGGEFKFKNKQDWTDKNYGDSGGTDECSGVASTSGGNILCSNFSGAGTITFNDNTLAYSFKPSVTYKTSLAGLYLLGDFNEFEGKDYRFSLIADNTWELGSVRLVPGANFKFSDLAGNDFGDGGSGKVVANGSNIVWSGSDGYYKIDFNDASLSYTTTLVAAAPPMPTDLIITGDDFGWSNPATPDPSQQFTKVTDGIFRITVALTAVGSNGHNGYLLIPQDSWGNWNHKFGGTGKLGGSLLYDGQNIPTPDVDGTYEITVNFNTNQYSLIKVN